MLTKMLIVGLAAATTAVATGTATFTLYSEPNCGGSVVETANLGELDTPHFPKNGQTFASCRVTDVSQSLLGLSPPVHGSIETSNQCCETTFKLTNSNPGCNNLDNAGIFTLTNKGPALGSQCLC
ncbi:hypothetical protein NA57DRAFT_79177 [Rhizodiscina lignyota]|uniref:Uncharacterized protein n=1 Tax=Rhizodiscina lignyota TaxID=1504668 RepID=A0A9P4I9P3_9PEZI|nr:hypothetical protein NA57DRAFT_79177 [Rhizodiscina lignyota]